MTKYLLAAALSLSLCAQADIVADVPSPSGDQADTCTCTFGNGVKVSTGIIVDNAQGIAASKFRICRVPLATTLPTGANTVTCFIQVTGSATVTAAVSPPSLPFGFSNSAPLAIAPSGLRLGN